MELRIRPLPLVLLTALIAGCSGGAANPPLTMHSSSERLAERSSPIESASKMKIRLVAALQATFTATGVSLELTDSRCAHKPIPKKLNDDGFPLDAVAFTTPHSARLAFTISPLENPCEKHSEAAHAMSFVFPSPVPSATPVFSTDGYYVIALQAGSNRRITMFDVSGPVSASDDSVLRFTQNWLPLSADDTYAFYLATLKNHHGDEDGD
jgi:hypothetical protein